MTKLSSTYLPQNLGGWGSVLRAFCSKYSLYKLATMGLNLATNIKESIYIRVNNPSLNNNIGKFNLSHIWDRVLLNTNGLSLK